ncbi:AAA family ATPase [Streptomyces sp. NBC_01431]|uniref:AAA family ATPase n=1 Tax=Streptomyces sp. NBC_01431 TaxID=2903863 RepID=UPI002E367812|nr:AAA family ATPase [Streptomyces sp. NBC_01431]
MELVGRQAEIAELLDIVEGGRGEPRMLLLLGEAGTGKSRLMAVAVGRARDNGTLVLASQGSEAESRQSFASLHQLLLPLLPDLGTLPEHLRGALESAFGIAPADGPPDPMLLRVAVLTLLTEVSRRQGILLAADDIQHFDRDSLDVLGFVMRRITADAVPVLLAARGQTPPDGVADLRTLLLRPLSERAAAEILDAQPHAPAGRTRIDLLRQAGGNPPAIIDLCRAATTGGAGPLPGGGLPQTERIQELYAARLRGLPVTTQRLILYATASEYEDLATIMAAADVGTALRAWGPAEEAGLVTVADGRVVFRHPLARAGSYHGANAHLRQQAHRDLAPSHEVVLRPVHNRSGRAGADHRLAAEGESGRTAAMQQSGEFLHEALRA